MQYLTTWTTSINTYSYFSIRSFFTSFPARSRRLLFISRPLALSLKNLILTFIEKLWEQDLSVGRRSDHVDGVRLRLGIAVSKGPIVHPPGAYDMGLRLYFPSTGRRAVGFYCSKNPSPRPGLNPPTLDSIANILTITLPRRLDGRIILNGSPNIGSGDTDHDRDRGAILWEGQRTLGSYKRRGIYSQADWLFDS
jgi:hypothetical protein